MHIDSLYHGTVHAVKPGELCVIGDVHGKLTEFVKRVRKFLEQTPTGQVIQLGDFSALPADFQYFLRDMLTSHEKGKIQIILGNHDAGVPLRHSMSLQDYGESSDSDIITIRGAATPHFARFEGRSYYGEELTIEQFSDIIKIIKGRAHKPRLIVTHDGPLSVIQSLWPGKVESPSVTMLGLQKVFEEVQKLPAHEQGTRWIFGHHHEHHKKIEGIDFHAIGELETLVV